MLNSMVRYLSNFNLWTIEHIIARLSSKQVVNKDKIMGDLSNVRWAINARNWKPSAEDFSRALRNIQPEEQDRIMRFVYQDDAKSSLLGRLMLRKYAQAATLMPYNKIKFGRDKNGKPFMLGVQENSVNVNVSHQGDYVVLAGHTKLNVGIDVMKIEPPANKNIPEFFRLMERQMSPHEWSTIRSYPTELEQIGCFYRLWVLKESYVKNIGTGITVPIADFSFCIKSPKLRVGKIVTDTVLYEKNVLKQGWVFEETMLDEYHAVAVSLNVGGSSHENNLVNYKFLTFEDLMQDTIPLSAHDMQFGEKFVKKLTKSF